MTGEIKTVKGCIQKSDAVYKMAVAVQTLRLLIIWKAGEIPILLKYYVRK